MAIKTKSAGCQGRAEAGRRTPAGAAEAGRTAALLGLAPPDLGLPCASDFASRFLAASMAASCCSWAALMASSLNETETTIGSPQGTNMRLIVVDVMVGDGLQRINSTLYNVS